MTCIHVVDSHYYQWMRSVKLVPCYKYIDKHELVIIVGPLARRQTLTVQASEGVMHSKIRVWFYRFQVTLKRLPRQQHLRNTLTSNCCAKIRHFILQGFSSFSIIADDGSRINSTTVERQTGGNN